MCRLDPPQRAPLPDVGIVVRDRMIPPDTRLAGSVPCLLRPELAETKHLALDLRALIRGLQACFVSLQTISPHGQLVSAALSLAARYKEGRADRRTTPPPGRPSRS